MKIQENKKHYTFISIYILSLKSVVNTTPLPVLCLWKLGVNWKNVLEEVSFSINFKCCYQSTVSCILEVHTDWHIVVLGMHTFST
jgi:hypothetical protein